MCTDTDLPLLRTSFCLVVGVGAVLLQRLQVRRHFLGVYLNLTANLLFAALLSGVFASWSRGLWFVALLAAVYTYTGSASLFLRQAVDPVGTVILLMLAAIAVLVLLVGVSRNFAREQ